MLFKIENSFYNNISSFSLLKRFFKLHCISHNLPGNIRELDVFLKEYNSIQTEAAGFIIEVFKNYYTTKK
jgi:hypothetical protein